MTVHDEDGNVTYQATGQIIQGTFANGYTQNFLKISAMYPPLSNNANQEFVIKESNIEACDPELYSLRKSVPQKPKLLNSCMEHPHYKYKKHEKSASKENVVRKNISS